MESTSNGNSQQVLGETLLDSDETNGTGQEFADSDIRTNTNDPKSDIISAGVAGVRSSADTSNKKPPSEYEFLAGDETRAFEGGESSSLGSKRSTSIILVLQQLSVGNTIYSQGQEWKLTRAVVHLEDAWKGRVSPCPSLEHNRTRSLFKSKWKYRSLDFFLVHMFLALSLVETPAWCEREQACYWSCYPDFTRNWHMVKWQSLSLEAMMLAALVALALLDVHVAGRSYWVATKGVNYQAMWFKHGVLALYSTIVLLALTIDFRAHAMCGYCRVLLYLSVHRRTMLVVTQLRHILGAVAEIWLLIFLNIVLFAWVGLVLFSGTKEGDAAFPNVFEAAWRLFVLFTTTNFPDIMLAAVDAVRATIIYFAGFVTLNVFFLAPLSLAFIFNVFRGGQKGIPRLEEDIRLSSSAAAFALLDDRGTGQVSVANMGAFLLEVHDMRGLGCRELARLLDLIEEASIRRPEEPSLDVADFTDAVRVMDRSLRHAEWITEVQWYFPWLHRSYYFKCLTKVVKHQRVTVWPSFGKSPGVSMLVMDFVDACFLVASFVTLFVASSYDDVNEEIVRYDWVQMGVVVGFCFTTSLCAVVRGWHNCVQRPTWVFNMVMTVPSVIVMSMAFTTTGEEWGWRVMRALRVCHLSLGIAFVPRLGFLVRTLLIMTRRAATPASVLLVWAFLMAVLGTQIFGGKVCDPDLQEGNETCYDTVIADNLYTKSGMVLLNFNDVPTSLVTVFVLFVVNDWYVIADEFVDVTGTGWARLYFIVNYIMGVAVILNLVVTVVINSFWDEYKDTNKPALALKQLHDAAAASAHHSSTIVPTCGDRRSCDGNNNNASSLPNFSPALDAEDVVDTSGSTERMVAGIASSGFRDEDGWHWRGISLDEEGMPIALSGTSARVAGHEEVPIGDALAARGGPDVGGVASAYLNSHTVGVTAPHTMAEGDQEGMAAERVIARRASRRRLHISGIT